MLEFFYDSIFDLEMEKHCKRKQRRRLLKLQVLQVLVEEREEAKELLRSDPFRLYFGHSYFS